MATRVVGVDVAVALVEIDIQDAAQRDGPWVVEVHPLEHEVHPTSVERTARPLPVKGQVDGLGGSVSRATLSPRRRPPRSGE